MTADFYQWSTEAQLEQFKQYLVKHTPHTTPFLGWLYLGKIHKAHPIESNQIWCTHSDPLNTSDIAVWIIDGGDRIRIFVNVEIELNNRPLTPEARDIIYNKNKPTTNLPRCYVDDKYQELYEKSLKEVTEFEDPCFRYLKQASQHSIKSEQLDPTLKLTDVSMKDIDTIKAATKIDYPIEYLQQCASVSTAIKTNDKDERLAAWVLTHREMFVGVLQVLPEWRRKGLANVLVDNIGMKYIELFKEVMPDTPLEKLYFTATVESFNIASAKLFEKMGWTLTDPGVIWILCKPRD
ncbi:hypothetical protein A0J61_03490 [Choanephora cucurbitarum]|uniref:N-acetyltransferase domain-containing protein n=1 Tax=Choanephora cucurbitarum TaxID=101091 RepID=A0A1C7NH88_9FUNG|nr:hypothetical protein A0J61_03490 [Choanephora cucurbitarum]